ncbi:MAG: hypothetical protein QOJ29_768, partial [Thermoleophilaceae bacterium]|nr:hypothetical protein [Thermoleophilaceae bacterium]
NLRSEPVNAIDQDMTRCSQFVHDTPVGAGSSPWAVLGSNQ